MRQKTVRSAVVSCALALAAMVAMLTVPASAAARNIKGEVITIMCYQGHGAKGTGQAHRSCAVSCAKKGYPLAILTADGTYYQIAGPVTADHNAKLQPLLAQKVTASGEISEKDGTKTITIAQMSDITASK